MRTLFVLFALALLAACGGGDDCDAGAGTFKPLPADCPNPPAPPASAALG
jgi:hypothetical protein